MPFGWTIPSTVFPRKAKMSSRDRRGVVPSTGEDQPRSSTHSPH